MVIRLFNTSIKVKWLLISLLIIGLILSGLKLWRISVPARSLYHTYTQIQAIIDNPGEVEVADLQPMLHQTHLDLRALQQELTPFAPGMAHLGWLPRFGGDVQSAPALLEMGVSLTEAGDIILTAMNPVIIMALGDERVDSASLLPIALETLTEAGPEFERAQRSIERARLARERIQVENLSPRLAKQLNRLDKVLPFSELAFEAIKVMPHLLGTTEPQTYLIIAQNNDELRATGGFMTAIGTLTVDQGKAANLSFEDSYAVDDFTRFYPDPPPQLLRYMLAEIWVFRDANWSPDYPTSVQAMLDLYHVSRDTRIDGVIAVDQLALQQVVAALEPLIVPNWEEPVTAENVIDLIRLQWSPGAASAESKPDWIENRKNFIGELVAAIRGQIEQTPGSVDWIRLGEAVLTILRERHLQLWFVDEAAQVLVEDYGWAGVIQPAPGDYLMVIDSNLGFNKTNAVMDMSLIYEVNLARGGSAEAFLTVRHQNNSPGKKACLHNPRSGEDGADYWEIIQRCYWSYLRVYTPGHSQLLDATPHSVPGEFLVSGQDEAAQVEILPVEVDKSVWGTLLLVPHGQSLETTFHYALPKGVIEETEAGWRYTLDVQKQAGTLANELRVVVHLPSGSQVLEMTPAPSKVIDNSQLVFDLLLQQDRKIEIIFE